MQPFQHVFISQERSDDESRFALDVEEHQTGVNDESDVTLGMLRAGIRAFAEWQTSSAEQSKINKEANLVFNVYLAMAKAKIVGNVQSPDHTEAG